jgi:hypothetical protein
MEAATMGKPSAPTPPDPRETAAAATSTNIGTAVSNNAMQMMDQYTPDGSLTYEQTGDYTYLDPFTEQSYTVPRYTSTQSLSPEAQAIRDQTMMAQTNLAGAAADQSGFLRDYLGEGMNLDTSATEERLMGLGRERLDPIMGQRRNDLQSRLANQGITPGSEAYSREMSAMGQQENDAYNSLLLSGRGQAFAEGLAERNQPINEITALMSGAQVSNPATQTVMPGGAATTDVAGLVNQNFAQKQSNYQQEMGAYNSLMGGLFSAGGAIGGAYMMPTPKG